MAPPRPLNDDLPMAEWQRLRNLSDQGRGDVPFAPTPLRDDMPMREWVMLRRQGAGGDVISGGAGTDQLLGSAGQDRVPAQASRPAKDAAARPAPMDPSKTPVFRTGPDGKLHPVPGWHTTGPFDFGTWAHNIDWGGVLRDLNKIASRSIGAAGVPGLLTRRGATGVTGEGLSHADRLTLGAGVDAAGDAALDDAAPKKSLPRR